MPSKKMIIPGAMDQVVPFKDLKGFLKKVDQHIASASNVKVMQFIGNLSETETLAGIGLARALFLAKRRWAELKMEKAFYDDVFAYTGKAIDTVDKYIMAWERLENSGLDEEDRTKLAGRGIKALIRTTQIGSKKGGLTTEEWKDLADAPDKKEFVKRLEHIRKPKETPTVSMPSVSLSRDGILAVWHNGHGVNLGALFNPPEPEEPEYELFQTGFELLMQGTPIIRRQ